MILQAASAGRRIASGNFVGGPTKWDSFNTFGSKPISYGFLRATNINLKITIFRGMVGYYFPVKLSLRGTLREGSLPVAFKRMESAEKYKRLLV